MTLTQPPTSCAWCTQPLNGVTCGTYFSTDIICQDCKEIEPCIPGYAAAFEAENAEVGKGNYAFPGVGLTPSGTTAVQWWASLRQNIGSTRVIEVMLQQKRGEVQGEMIGDDFAVVCDEGFWHDGSWAPFHLRTGLNASWFSSELRARGMARAMAALDVSWVWSESGSPEWQHAMNAVKPIVQAHRDADKNGTTPETVYR